MLNSGNGNAWLIRPVQILENILTPYVTFRPSERSIITLPEAPLGDLVVISQEPVNVTLSVSLFFDIII